MSCSPPPLSPKNFTAFRAARATWTARIQRANDGTAADVQFMPFPYYAATSSYLVNPGSVDALCHLLGQALETGANSPIDLFFREQSEQGKLRVNCLFPFIASVAPAAFESTIDADYATRRSKLAMDMPRHSFFVECDQNATARLAERLLVDPNADAQARLHARVAGFLSSDAWRSF